MTDYPTTIDNNPPLLEDDQDSLNGEALSFHSEILEALQALIGLGSTDVELGDESAPYGALAAIFLAVCRVQTGFQDLQSIAANTAGPSTNSTIYYSYVTFQEGKFTIPPYVILQPMAGIRGSGGPADYVDNYTVDKVTTNGCRVTSHIAATGSTGGSFSWMAIQPPFGWSGDAPENDPITPIWYPQVT